jgi:hypothetical protein
MSTFKTALVLPAEPPPPGALFSFQARRVPLGQKIAMSLGLAQDSFHLHHFLKTPQQGVLAFTITYSNF